MIVVYIALGMFVHYIFLTRRELLIQKRSFNLILVASSILFLAGLVLNFVDVTNHRAYTILLMPLITAGLFRLLRKLFVQHFGREPKDTFFNWEDGLFWDRLLNIVVGALPFALCIMFASLFEF